MKPYDEHNTNERKRYFSEAPQSSTIDDEQRLEEQHVDNFGQTHITDYDDTKGNDIEFASEFITEDKKEADLDTDEFMNQSFGWLAVVLAILAFFTMPILFGVAGIVLGFISRNRGHVWLGNTAIALSVLALIIQLIVFPFV